MTTSLDLSTASPVEIDLAWIEAAAPGRKLRERRAELMATSRRYAKYSGYAEQAARYAADADKLNDRITEAELPLAAFIAEWNARGGWSRAYLVPDGHIHKSTSCSSLHPTTLISWLPELSGSDEETIVAAAGIQACTICYPTAPVDALKAALAAEKSKTECPGSRTWDHDSSGLNYYQPRAKCNHCHKTVSATSTGKLRAHKLVTA